MIPYNLVDSPWIAVRYHGGDVRRVSLDTLFREASAIADLDAAPHERIALIRLLVCLTQAELGAPETPEDWGDFGQDLTTRIPAYLHRADIHPHFELFGDGSRFLQVQISTDAEPVSASKLIPHLATGNNSTLLDHEGASTTRQLTPDRLALALLSFQCFYPLYGAGYKGRGPCVDSNMLHTLIVGSSLQKAILSNCLTQDYIDEYYFTGPAGGMGRPLWELNPAGKDFFELATGSYLGRLVPRHRNLWLLEDGSGFRLTREGLEYPRYDQAREPSATVVISQKKDQQERRLLSARLGKSIWRDLHTMTVIRQSRQDEARAPLILHAQVRRIGNTVPIWTGALVADNGKILDTIESTFTLPSAMLSAEGRILYENGVQHAETQANQIYGAVKQYGTALKNEKPPTDLAKQHYWNTLESRHEILLDLVRQIDTHPLTENFGEGDDPWSKAVWAAARAAYEKVCPRQTPRQIQAYAAGLKVLRPKSKSQQKTTKEPVTP